MKPRTAPRYRRLSLQRPDELTRAQRDLERLMRERPEPDKGARP